MAQIAVTKLAIVAVAPASDSAIGKQRADVPVARDDRAGV